LGVVVARHYRIDDVLLTVPSPAIVRLGSISRLNTMDRDSICFGVIIGPIHDNVCSSLYRPELNCLHIRSCSRIINYRVRKVCASFLPPHSLQGQPVNEKDVESKYEETKWADLHPPSVLSVENCVLVTCTRPA
jgi:hypothetical protein